MSQTETPVPGKRRGGGSGGSGSSKAAPVRWVVLFTGSKATEDYQPLASDGESAALVQEVTELNVAFHPHTEIRLFPSDRDVLLFWKANSTGDHIVTRVVQAPNPQGVRTALEYVSLVLSDEELANCGYDPFRGVDLGVFDKVREQVMAKNHDRVLATLTPAPVPGASAAPLLGPDITSDHISTAQNYDALRAYCGSGLTAPPPTFASWWSSTGEVPPGRFEIVLRAEPPRALLLREAGEVASALVAEIKASLPNAPSDDAVAVEMSRGLLTGADAVYAGITSAASRINEESQDQFRSRLGEAAGVASRLASDLHAYGQRLSLPANGSGATLADWAMRYETLARDLPGIRHPNPFAARTPLITPTKPPSGTRTTDPSAPTNAGMKYGIIAAAVAAIVLIGLVITFLASSKKPAGSSGTPSTSPVPQASAATPANSAPSPAADPVSAILMKSQSAALEPAKAKAHDEAKAGAAKADLSEKGIEKVVFSAVKAGYKATLPPADFQKVFSGTTPWTYSRLLQAAPTLVPAVHEAAVAGAAEARGARTAPAAVKSATPAPTPKAERSHSEETPKPSKPHSEEPTPKPSTPKAATPKPATPKPATPKPATPKPVAPPKTGSADETGL